MRGANLDMTSGRSGSTVMTSANGGARRRSSWPCKARKGADPGVDSDRSDEIDWQCWVAELVATRGQKKKSLPRNLNPSPFTNNFLNSEPNLKNPNPSIPQLLNPIVPSQPSISQLIKYQSLTLPTRPLLYLHSPFLTIEEEGFVPIAAWCVRIFHHL